MQKIRAKIEKPSEEFFKFLEVVNSIAGVSLPSYAALFEAFRLICFGETGNESEANHQALDRLEVYLTDLIKKHSGLCKYIFDKTPDEEISSDDFWQFGVHRYEPFRIERETITNATHLLDDKSEKAVSIMHTSTRVIIGVDAATGFLFVENYEFRNFKNLDLRRFKFCPVCAEIFWAFRSDKKACDKCSNLYRQKTFQSKNKNEINEKRRATYKQNKKVKELKKKNGTL